MKRLYIWLSIIALALIAGLVVFGPGQGRDEAEPPAQAAGGNEPADAAVASKDEEQQEPVPTHAEDAGSPAAEPEATVAQTNDKTFRVNASGRLVLDEQTRL